MTRLTVGRHDPQEGDYAQRDGIDVLFRALANPTRLLIVGELARPHRNALSSPGLTISELAARIEVSRFVASHHLQILKEVAFVECNKIGHRKIHTLNRSLLLQVEDWLYSLLEPYTDDSHWSSMPGAMKLAME
jgi:DNA-binding transcriptional ArsR family regulator